MIKGLLANKINKIKHIEIFVLTCTDQQTFTAAATSLAPVALAQVT